MNTRILSALAGIVVALGVCGGTAAGESSAAVEALERERTAALAALAHERRHYPRYFERAYARYPGIPRGVLEAIAYAQTGWTHVAPDPAAIVHRLDPVDVAAVGLHALHAQHAAAAMVALEPAHRIRQRVAVVPGRPRRRSARPRRLVSVPGLVAPLAGRFLGPAGPGAGQRGERDRGGEDDDGRTEGRHGHGGDCRAGTGVSRGWTGILGGPR